MKTQSELDDGPSAQVGLAARADAGAQGIVTLSRVGRPNHNTPWWPANYRAGTWAWVLHRVTGLVLVGYLFLHVWVISFSAIQWGGFSFGQVMALFQTPPFVVLDLGLLAVILFHSLNGIRILLFDIGIGVRSQKQLFWSAAAVTVFVELVSAYLWLSHIIAARV